MAASFVPRPGAAVVLTDFQSRLAGKGSDPVQHYEDLGRTYHGVKSAPRRGSKGDEQEWEPARILVEYPETGPTGTVALSDRPPELVHLLALKPRSRS